MGGFKYGKVDVLKVGLLNIAKKRQILTLV
jgi:hypothetical protein